MYVQLANKSCRLLHRYCVPPFAVVLLSVCNVVALVAFIVEVHSSYFAFSGMFWLVGANGVGKSSILKAILGQIAIDSGSIEVGETVVLGYFDQDGLVSEEEQAMRVLEYVSQVSSHVGGGYLASNGGTSSQGGGDFESKLDAQLERLSYSAAVPMQKSENPNPLAHLSPIQLLDQFGFGRQQQHAFISTLSGGERRRLQLLSLLVSNPNCMLLDEVSNDIDIRTLSMLEELLDAFSGTLVVVSHDRMYVPCRNSKLLRPAWKTLSVITAARSRFGLTRFSFSLVTPKSPLQAARSSCQPSVHSRR